MLMLKELDLRLFCVEYRSRCIQLQSARTQQALRISILSNRKSDLPIVHNQVLAIMDNLWEHEIRVSLASLDSSTALSYIYSGF